MSDIELDEPEIRLFVTGPSGLGHQASSLMALESIVADPAWDGLGYRGLVTVVYEGGVETRRKLSQLFPPLAGARGKVRVEGATVRLVPLRRAGSLPKVSLGLTGGADFSRRFAELARTRTFLRLQPYRWADMWVSCRDDLQFEGGGTDTDIPLPSMPDLGPRFAERSFHVPVPGSPWLARQRPPSPRERAVEELLNDADDGRVRIWPIYGVRTTVHARLRQPAGDTLFTLACAALAYQDKHPGPPIVIMLLDRIDPRAPERPLIRLKALLAGGRTQSEEDGDRAANPCRVAFVRQLGCERRVQLIGSRAASRPPVEGARMRAHSAAPVQVLNIGPLSASMFRRSFATAGLPPLFEGAGTASVALSVGRPYLHVAREEFMSGEVGRMPASLYPTAYVRHPDTDRLALASQQAANVVTEPLERWPPSDNPAERLARFLAAVEPGSEHELAQYFRRVTETYQDPAHDRLRLGLAAARRYL
jgi:hypothetical protein